MNHRAKPQYTENFPYLLKLLACVLNDSQPPKPNAQTDWASVFSIAENHSVTGMLSYAVMKLPVDLRPDDSIRLSLDTARQGQIVAEANIQYETDIILNKFREQGIDAVPLKGIVLKNDYPHPSMRTMSDVDILYDTSRKNDVRRIFESLGYKFVRENNDQLDFVKPPFHTYEMHSTMVADSKFSYSYYNNIWDRVEHTDGDCVGYLGVNDSYLFMLDHLAKHFEGSGAGIRLVMDIYVFLKAHNKELDWNYLKGELSKLQLLKFEEIIRNLSFSWFDGGEPNTDSVLADFILCSCTFGVSRNAIIQHAMHIEEKSGTKHTGVKMLLQKIFPSYRNICSRFPSSRKSKLLYPLYIPAYWYMRIFKDRNINTDNIAYYFESTDSDDSKRIRQVISDLGLSDRR